MKILKRLAVLAAAACLALPATAQEFPARTVTIVVPFAPSAMTPVALLGRYPLLLFVRADLPVGSVQELIAYAKKAPKPLTTALAIGSAESRTPWPALDAYPAAGRTTEPAASLAGLAPIKSSFGGGP